MCQGSSFHPWGFRPHEHVKYILLCSSFLILSIIYLGSRLARTAEQIPIVDSSKQVFWRKGVPFGCLINDLTKLGRNSLKTPLLGPVMHIYRWTRIANNKKTALHSTYTESYNVKLVVSCIRTFKISQFEHSPTPPSGLNSPTVRPRRKVSKEHQQ
jgi:hypothetical protein